MLTRLAACLLALVLLGAQPIPAAAQSDPLAQVQVDYDAWEELARRAETAVEEGRASTVVLEALRADIALARGQFQDAEASGAQRLATLRAQLDALGPVPEPPATEPADIADRRKDLTDQIAAREAPVLKAQEAYQRADGIISEIDAIIRQRQAVALLDLGPTPLNPVHWGTTVTAVSGTIGAIGQEIMAGMNSEAQMTVLRARLPGIATLGLFGLVPLVLGRRWTERSADYLLAHQRPGWGRRVLLMAVSLGQIALPYLGALSIVNALDRTGLTGLRGAALLEALPQLALSMILARWLARQVFARRGPGDILVLDTGPARQGKIAAVLLGLMLGLRELVQEIALVEDYDRATLAVLGFVIVAGIATAVLRLVGLVRLHLKGLADTAPDARNSLRAQVLRQMARGALLGAAACVALGAVGYMRLADGVASAGVLTLALAAAVAILQALVLEIYATLTRQDLPTAREDLAPILIDFVLVLAAVPVLALIWGARPTDLGETWAAFLNGISIGGARISPTNFLIFVTVFVLGYMATRLVQGTLRSTVLPKTRIDPGAQTALVSGVGYIGVMVAAVVAITAAGIDLSSLAIVAGALSVGIGFGLQTIVSNFVSGIILLIERPIRQGDWIQVGDVQGYVRDISVRSTRIETFDRSDVILPNADLISGTVTNFTRGNLIGRLIVEVGVAYGTDTRKVQTILQEVAESHPMVILNPPPFIMFKGFGADSLDFDVRMILRDVNAILSVRSEINHRIAERFAAEGIEIPFAQRDVWLRNPEALAASALAAPSGDDDPEDAAEDAPGAPDPSATM